MTHGRKTKCNPERTELIADALANGQSIDAASHSANISPRTYHGWIERGLTEQHRLDQTETDEQPNPTEAPYVHFLQETARALATFEAELIGDLKRVAHGYQIEETDKDGEVYYRTAIDWRAGAWLLERKFPDRYGNGKQKVELSGPDGGPLRVVAEDWINSVRAMIDDATAEADG